jgi:hypothetical protein
LATRSVVRFPALSNYGKGPGTRWV